MANLIIDRNTLQVKGINHSSAQSYEFEIPSIDVSNVTKQVEYTEPEVKTDINNKPLYYLPQASIIKLQDNFVTIESIDVSTIPVMITEIEKDPLLDSSGQQVRYEIKVIGETTNVTDQPIMINIIDETTGKTTTVQKVNINNQPLYLGLIGTGQFQNCFTTREITKQKIDTNGKLLYYKTVNQPIEIKFPQNPLEINDNDSRYIEGLERVFIDKVKTKTVHILDDPESFTYNDLKVYPDVNEKILKKLRELKVDELWKACNEVILNGFESAALGTVHKYKSEMDDQINTIGVLTLLNADPSITEITFKTVDSGFLVHSRVAFLAMYRDGETHKRNNIMRYNTFKFQTVPSATTPETIQAIKW